MIKCHVSNGESDLVRLHLLFLAELQDSLCDGQERKSLPVILHHASLKNRISRVGEAELQIMIPSLKASNARSRPDAWLFILAASNACKVPCTP